MDNKYLVKEIMQMITLTVTIAFLCYAFSYTHNLMSKAIVAVFIVLFVNAFLRNLFLLLNQNRLAELISKLNTIIFITYWFGFLIYWDYVSFTSGEYILLLFSIPFLFSLAFMVYKEFKKK